tara:strand:- start:780 stop:1787 length:1008 start_codon:yes stop_codon:yes gene_type:complete
MSAPLYKAFKKEKICLSLKRAGLSTAGVKDVFTLNKNFRRRATFQYSMRGKKPELGFYERGSHTICGLETCLVLDPQLVSLLVPLKEFLGRAIPCSSQGAISVLLSETGIDIALKTKSGIKQDLAFHEAVRDFSESQGLARLSLDGEILLTRIEPVVTFGGAPVAVSAESFLQVNKNAEEAMLSLLLDHLPRELKRVADLFAGRGLFALSLKEVSKKVDAFEMDKRALGDLCKVGGSFSSVDVFSRNLFSNPLNVSELAFYEAIVLDPPRDGARQQCEQLALSGIPLICYVSCKPETFARDARILEEGGYRLESVYPIDQFKWSHHIELISFFKK